jgi:uncharacterized oligopeptide transporter (OPT) family protein
LATFPRLPAYGIGLAYPPALAAVLAVLAAIRAWYKRTLGRRSDRYQRIGRLGTARLVCDYADAASSASPSRM